MRLILILLHIINNETKAQIKAFSNSQILSYWMNFWCFKKHTTLKKKSRKYAHSELSWHHRWHYPSRSKTRRTKNDTCITVFVQNSFEILQKASNVSSFPDLSTDKQCQCSSYYNDLLAKGTIFYAQFKTEYFSRSKKVWKRLLQKFPNRKLSSKNLLTNQLCCLTFFFKIVFSLFSFRKLWPMHCAISHQKCTRCWQWNLLRSWRSTVTFTCIAACHLFFFGNVF